MELQFEVGEHERHEVTARWDQFWGWFAVCVDGSLRYRKFRMYGGYRRSLAWESTIGDAGQQLRLKVEKTRPLLAAGYRAQELVATVNGEVVARGRTKRQGLVGIVTAVLSVAALYLIVQALSPLLNNSVGPLLVMLVIVVVFGGGLGLGIAISAPRARLPHREPET